MEGKSLSNQPTEYITTKFRFVELLLFMFIGMMNQVIWVTFAPFVEESKIFYGVSEFWIVFLAASFMVAYIPVNFPACWMIDKYGLKWGVGVGVILTGVFGFIRGIFAGNFVIVVISQIMCAIGQPFLLNSFTKLASTWFPEKEKATASGLGTIATLIGAIIAMLLPGMLGENFDIANLLLGYGIVSLLSMVLFLVFAKDRPEHAPNPYADKAKALATKNTKDLFKIKDFNLLLVILFFGLGAFNAITTKIDLIFNSEWDSGLIGGAMIIGGIFGAIILSGISDATHKRKIFINIAMISAVPLCILMALINVFWVVLAIGLIFGFLLVSCMPVGLTYAAEITYPAPEETSNGLLMVLGQIGGLFLLLVPDEILMYIVAGLFLLGGIISFLIEDTDVHEARRKQKE